MSRFFGSFVSGFRFRAGEMPENRTFRERIGTVVLIR
jgi:hypothetical protein